MHAQMRNDGLGSSRASPPSPPHSRACLAALSRATVRRAPALRTAKHLTSGTAATVIAQPVTSALPPLLVLHGLRLLKCCRSLSSSVLLQKQPLQRRVKISLACVE